MSALDLSAATTRAQQTSMVIHACGTTCSPELVIVGMGGERVTDTLFRFADGSLITAAGIVFVGGIA